MIKENNPIQERVDQMLLKWTLAINTPKVNIVRILVDKEEIDMLDAYYQYMLAIDTDQEDFVMILSAPFTYLEDYGKALIEEIEQEIKDWNEAEIPEIIKFETITWKPDYTLGSETNDAQLFIENINSFANYLQPDKKVKVSIILNTNTISKKDAFNWFSQVLENRIEPHVILGVSDTTEDPIYNKLAKAYPEAVYTIVPEFEMDAAIEQMAALGDPSTEETPYRASLAKLINGVKKRDKTKVQHAAKGCLDIAVKSLKKDSNWLMQIVTIYTILYNDQLGYKNYKDALYFADKAVESALISKDLIEPNVSYRLIGQTHLGRGALLQLKKEKAKALEDYLIAATAYETAEDYLMQCESLRLSGWMATKLYEKEAATQYYVKAYHLKDKLQENILKASTYPLVVKELLKNSRRLAYISNEQMNEDMTPLFGTDWRNHIDKYGKIDKTTNTIHQ